MPFRTPAAALAVLLTVACSQADQMNASGETGAPPVDVATPMHRCINLANALEAPNEGDWGYRIEDAHLRLVAEAGFDTVRLPVAWSEHTGPAPAFDIEPAFFRRVDEVVNQALARDLMVIIDVHHFGEVYAEPATHSAELRAIWRQVAERYAHLSNDEVFFELLNEPRDALEGGVWDKLAADLVTVIRNTNPERTIIVGGGNWNSAYGLDDFNPPADPNLVATFHYYEPYEFTHQGNDFSDDPPPLGRRWGTRREHAALQEEFDLAAQWSRAHAMPVFLGEFGVFRDAAIEERAEWTHAVRAAAEARGMGWCVFDFAASFIVYDLERDAWIPELLDALDMPERP